MKEYYPNTLGLKILGRDGNYVDFAGIAYMGDKEVWQFNFSNRSKLLCTLGHRVMTPKGFEYVADLEVGAKVLRRDGRYTRLISVDETKDLQPVYDIVEAADGNVYSTNGVISHQCRFVTDEETLIDAMCLSRLRTVDPAYYTEQIRWYIEPLPNRSYMVALDPSLGTGGDFAAIQVFMLPELIQVAEWQHNKTDVRGQVRILLQALNTLQGDLMDDPEQHGEPEIFWTVENNSIGEAVLLVIADTGEEKFPGAMVNERRQKGKSRRFRKGLTTTSSSKLSSCARLKSLVESDRMIINSQQALKELKSFVARGNSYSAKPGEHDDLVSGLLLITRMLDINIALGFDVGDDLKETISDSDIWAEPMPVVI